MGGISVDAYERVCEEKSEAWAAFDRVRHERDDLRTRIEALAAGWEAHPLGEFADDYLAAVRAALSDTEGA